MSWMILIRKIPDTNHIRDTVLWCVSAALGHNFMQMPPSLLSSAIIYNFPNQIFDQKPNRRAEHCYRQHTPRISRFVSSWKIIYNQIIFSHSIFDTENNLHFYYWHHAIKLIKSKLKFFCSFFYRR